MTGGPEWATVESPFIDHLDRLGWKFVTGNLEDPTATGRESFREVLITPDLREALQTINLRDGRSWLDDSRVSQAVSALERIATPKLMEANRLATSLLLKGIDVEGLPDWEQGRARTVHFIDWDRPERNQYTVMNQFRVDCPGWRRALSSPTWCSS
jgi:type I restriction enzyme R subunit